MLLNPHLVMVTLMLFFWKSVVASEPASMVVNDLSSTSWQLVAIQSMDDDQGKTSIEEPMRFTLKFGMDNQVILRLDCNRGMASYGATPSKDGHSGSMQFGQIVTTRAQCPPPNLDIRVARDLSCVRGYLLKDGKLYLSLMADGGIYEWAPLE